MAKKRCMPVKCTGKKAYGNAYGWACACGNFVAQKNKPSDQIPCGFGNGFCLFEPTGASRSKTQIPAR